MIKTFTTNDQVRYLYELMSDDERKSFDENLSHNAEESAEIEKMLEVKLLIGGLRLQPKESTIERILEYSKSVNLHGV